MALQHPSQRLRLFSDNSEERADPTLSFTSPSEPITPQHQPQPFKLIGRLSPPPSDAGQAAQQVFTLITVFSLNHF